MNRTAIEWTDYSLNPVKGLCPQACSYCYARRIYKRFHLDESIRYVAGWAKPLMRAKPGRVFVGSTMELFGPWIRPEWLRGILEAPRAFPEHTFIFLTKRPWEYRNYNPWQRNCWLGVSVEGFPQMMDRYGFRDWSMSTDAPVRFISFEPLLGAVPDVLPYTINWVIIGAQTPHSKHTDPQRRWIESITHTADKRGIPVFQKNNLRPIIGENLRQEWPALRSAGWMGSAVGGSTPDKNGFRRGGKGGQDTAKESIIPDLNPGGQDPRAVGSILRSSS